MRPSHAIMSTRAMARSACWPALICSPANRSREFVEFLKLLDAAYPAHTAIKLILDNHSAHISKETKAWLAGQTSGRFESTFTPKHGSLAQPCRGLLLQAPPRSVLRHIRVASKQELKERIMAAINDINQHLVVHNLDLQIQQSRQFKPRKR
jgi:DDE superfamily endonuclease